MPACGSFAVSSRSRRLSALSRSQFLQLLERHDLQGHRVGRLEHDLRCGVGVQRLLPACRAQAPAIARLQPGETVFRHGRGQVVAPGLGEGQELGRHDGANRVQAHVLAAGIAAAITIEAGQRGEGAGLQRSAQHVDRGRAAGPAFFGRLVEHDPV